MLIELPFTLPGKIYRSPMPFSRFDNQDLWRSFQELEIGVVVVLTEQQEYLVYAGKDLPAFYRSHGLETLQIPVPDFGIPQDLRAWKQGLDAAISAARHGKNVAVHCLAGIGRTGTFMACLARELHGMDGRQAISWVRESVPGAMESALQEDFVIKFDPQSRGEDF